MTFFSIDGVDFTPFVASYSIGYETLLSDKSGRTARGNAVVDIVSRKIKLTVEFLPMGGTDMKALLAAVRPYAGLAVTYWDAEADAAKTITAYIGTPEVTALRLAGSAARRRYGAFSLSFVEM